MLRCSTSGSRASGWLGRRGASSAKKLKFGGGGGGGGGVVEEKKKKRSVAVTVTDGTGKEHRLSGEEGTSVFDVARRNGIEIEGPCEGCLACGLCGVEVDAASLASMPPAEQSERDMVTMARPGSKPNTRLACQVFLRHDGPPLSVKLPPQQPSAPVATATTTTNNSV